MQQWLLCKGVKRMFRMPKILVTGIRVYFRMCAIFISGNRQFLGLLTTQCLEGSSMHIYGDPSGYEQSIASKLSDRHLLGYHGACSITASRNV